MAKVETPHDDLTYKIIGLAMKVHNELGPGLPEEAYQKAMAILLAEEGAHCDYEFAIEITFRGRVVSRFELDLVVDQKVILELKAVAALAPVHEQQTLTYLAASGLEVALLINFGASRLEYKRLFPSKAVQSSPAYQARQAALKQNQKDIR